MRLSLFPAAPGEGRGGCGRAVRVAAALRLQTLPQAPKLAVVLLSSGASPLPHLSNTGGFQSNTFSFLPFLSILVPPPPTSNSGFTHAGKRLVFGQAQSGQAGSKLRPGAHDPSAEPALSGNRPPRTPVPERLQPHSQGTDLGVLRVPNSGTVPGSSPSSGQSPHSPGHLGSPQSPHSLGHPQVRRVAPPPTKAPQFCLPKCARPFLSATSRISSGVRHPSARDAVSPGRPSTYGSQRATNARHADLPGCEQNQEQKGTHKTVHIPKDDGSSS